MKVFFEYAEDCEKLKCFNPNIIEEATKTITEYFPELKDTRILLYFNHFPNDYRNWRHGTATIFPLNYPHSNIDIEFPFLAISLQKYNCLDFAIHFTRLITEGDEITIAINISHEFQHAVQYKNSKKIYLYGRIICYFLGDQVISEEETPIEYDAIRKSKIIAYDLYGKEEVDEYVQRMLLNPNIKKYPSVLFHSIKINKDFNFENEVSRLWDEYKIEEKIEELKHYRDINNNQKKIIEMYDFASS